MKTITMSQLRAEPGERLIDIRRNRDSFLVTKAGKPAAILGPVEDGVVIQSDGTILGERPLTFRQNLGGYY